ncbi:MAG: L,D-transpeptidase family protein [Pseudomonadota bacterium]
MQSVRHVAGARRNLITAVFAVFGALFLFGAGQPVSAQDTAFKQAAAQAAASDPVLAEFYREIGYGSVWTGTTRQDKQRLRALLGALDGASDHALPVAKYNVRAVEAQLSSARSSQARGALDVQLSKLFLSYASDVGTGVLVPSRVDGEIKRAKLRRDPLALMRGVRQGPADKFMAQLPPRTPEYTRLMKGKIELEKLMARGGWGPEIRVGKLEPGMAGPQVVALRDRLIRMGYMRRSTSQSFDNKLTEAVRSFQYAHGLATDGVVGEGTLEEINKPVSTRLAQVVVAMERERWMNFNRGRRHVLVNLPDYSAKIIDKGKVTFETRAVVGANRNDHRSPEFSDEMEFMVVNPSWYVPRSIATKEYLPLLQQNPYAVSHLELRDRSGRLVDRSAVDFASLTPANWPFSMKEPPSQGNALGVVKFMFPNRHNIYLHDTPQKSLFNRERRAFSHGCIRLADPRGFAFALLAPQTNNPKGTFERALAVGSEVQIDLDVHVPVHLIYRTAVTTPKGNLQFRRDIYGRDARIFRALTQAGVELRPRDS